MVVSLPFTSTGYAAYKPKPKTQSTPSTCSTAFKRSLSMEFVSFSLAIVISGVNSLTADGSSLFTTSRQAENVKNNMIVRAKEPVIRNRFFFLLVAWLIPREVSTLKSFVLAAWTIFLASSVFPVTAAAGETFAACFAGE